jgi:hypothetical protein
MTSCIQRDVSIYVLSDLAATLDPLLLLSREKCAVRCARPAFLLVEIQRAHGDEPKLSRMRHDLQGSRREPLDVKVERTRAGD